LAILGIDEVGRGPWAGPLVVGACLLPESIEGLNDSKKLSVKKREELAEVIREKAIFGLGWVSAAELDELGLTEALCKAARDAVSQIKGSFDEVIIDGTMNFLRGTEHENITQFLPKADQLVPEVSAASIIAKVSRDHYMYEIADKYPGYGFEKHVGYGTTVHKAAIEKLGLCPEHRRSFRPIAEFAKKEATKPKKRKAKAQQTVEPGARAEAIVTEALRRKNHTIIARNWKTKYCEIDIVSSFKGVVYFTEVKYSRNTANSRGLDRVNSKKLEQMRFAAESYIASSSVKCDVRLAVAEVSGDNFRITAFQVLQ
jgi:ribonuclease HII